MKTDAITFRVDGALKADAIRIFEQIGMDASTAFTVFLKKVIQVGGIPFAVTTNPELPRQTVAAIEEGRKILSGEMESPKFSSVDDLMRDLQS